MFSKRVLITTYHNAYLVRGGGEFEIISIADSLRKLGAIADLYGPYSRSIEHYDVILHFSVHPAGLDLLRAIKAAGKPVVLWPNLWVTGVRPSADVVNEYIYLAEYVVFKSRTEKQHFCALFDLPESKIVIVPAGVDTVFARSAPPDLFRSLYGLKEYALWLGIIEPVKNQLTAIRALKQLNIPLVLVGKCRDSEYLNACQAEAGKDVMFIEGLPYKSEIVGSALQESLFYIEISQEPAGLSAISAAVAGCKLVLSDLDWSREHFEDQATYVDPASIDSVCKGVQEALSSPPRYDLSQKILDKHGLPDALASLLDIFSAAGKKR